MKKVGTAGKQLSHHCSDFHCALISPLVLWHALNASLLDAKSARNALQLGVQASASNKGLAMDSTRLIGHDAAAVLLVGTSIFHIIP